MPISGPTPAAFRWLRTEAKPPREPFDRAAVAELAAELERREIPTARGLATWRHATVRALVRDTEGATGGPSPPAWSAMVRDVGRLQGLVPEM